MQYSTNSDAAIAFLVRSKATPVGRYRQAFIQMRDREKALQINEIERRRNLLKLEMKKLEIERCQQYLDDLNDIEKRATQVEIELLRLDLKEIELAIATSDELVEDAVREIAACRSELDKVREETGLDFGSIPTEVFQGFMTDEFRKHQSRWMAAQTISANLGVPPSVAELLLEIPAEEQAEYLNEINQHLAQFQSNVSRGAIAPGANEQ